jgi:hypothetical protein
MEWKIPVVINDDYGGFSLTQEIVNRLKKRDCTWVDKCGYVPSSRHYYLPYRHEFDGDPDELRKDPDLVAVVREVSAEYDAIVDADDCVLSWREQVELRRKMIGCLHVADVRIRIEIESHDGKESVRVTGGTW